MAVMQNVDRLMKLKGVSQPKLSRAIGVAQQSVQQMLKRTPVWEDRLRKIAECLDVSIADLFADGAEAGGVGDHDLRQPAASQKLSEVEIALVRVWRDISDDQKVILLRAAGIPFDRVFSLAKVAGDDDAH